MITKTQQATEARVLAVESKQMVRRIYDYMRNLYGKDHPAVVAINSRYTEAVRLASEMTRHELAVHAMSQD